MKNNYNSNLKKYSSAQVKFGETFAVLIVVYFAFVFGAQLYISSLENSFTESQIQTQDTQALETLDYVLNYPLFLNSRDDSTDLVFNELNINAFSELDNLTKNAIFRNTLISIELYEPSFNYAPLAQSLTITNSGDVVILHNNSRNFFDSSGNFIGSRIIPHSSVVNVYNPETKEQKIGILRILVYY